MARLIASGEPPARASSRVPPAALDDLHVRRRTREPTRAGPAPRREDEAPRARGAPSRVREPSGAGRDPGHVRDGARRPGHEWVVAVGHDPRAPDGRRLHQGGTPPRRGHPHLVGAVQLVAREVQEHHRDGCELRQRARQVALVHLQHGGAAGVARPRRLRQRGGVARRHVGAGRIGHHRPPPCRERGDEERRRRRLAVGAAHEGHLPRPRQVPHEVRLEGERHPAARHRAAAEAEPAGHAVDRVGSRRRELDAGRLRRVPAPGRSCRRWPTGVGGTGYTGGARHVDLVPLARLDHYRTHTATDRGG